MEHIIYETTKVNISACQFYLEADRPHQDNDVKKQ